MPNSRGEYRIRDANLVGSGMVVSVPNSRREPEIREANFSFQPQLEFTPILLLLHQFFKLASATSNHLPTNKQNGNECTKLTKKKQNLHHKQKL